MLFDPGKQHSQDTVRNKGQGQGCENSASAPRLNGRVRQIWLDDTLDLGLLALRIVTCLLKRCESGGELLVRQIIFEFQPLEPDRALGKRTAHARYLARLGID